MSRKCYRFYGGLISSQENWLNKMAKNGYRLIYTGKLLYEFEECKPGQYQYCVEFVGQKAKESADDYSELRGSQLKMENQVIQRLLAAERGQYQISKESIDIINMKCHDLKHQIAAVRAASRQDQQSALRRIEDAVTIYDAVARTGNETLDAVLTEKILYCEKHGISLTYMVDQENLSFLDPQDLYVLFGNALDNAIENAMKEDEDKRVILLNICRKSGFLSIHLENYCKTPPVFRDGLPQTTKKDVQNHGFGVRSIRYLAEQYGGHTVFQTSRNMFFLDIMIPIPS